MMESEEQTIHTYTHHDGEVWGLAVLPEKGTFLTCGDDNQFFEVNLIDRKVVRNG